MNELEISLRTLTPLWTGGVDQTCDHLHETGLIGSLRWWYEALVRGLDGYACDPRGDNHCEYDSKKPASPEKQLCAACFLFGCTGWARRFRLRVLDANQQLVQDALQENTDFVLRFIELRPISSEEKWLLRKMVKIAVEYGSLGGKTTHKPQRGPRGADFGIVKWIQASDIQRQVDAQSFLRKFRQNNNPPDYPNFRHFFFFKKVFLHRLQMNPLLGLDENGKPLSSANEAQQFLQGKRGTTNQDAASKRIFSFQIDGGRIWGYARDLQMRDQIIDRIKEQFGSLNYTVKNGEEVLNEL